MISHLKTSLLPKDKLWINYSLKDPIEFEGFLDPIFLLLNTIIETQKINEKENSAKALYFNKNKLHKILYEEEEDIFIKSTLYSQKLSYLFFLNLLIYDNLNIINYN